MKNKSLAPLEDKYYNEEFTIQLPSQKKITDIKWLAGITSTSVLAVVLHFADPGPVAFKF